MLGKQLAIAILWTWLCQTLVETESAKILMICPYDTPSQYIMNAPYIAALYERGHELTVIHAYKNCDALQGVQYIYIQDTYNAFADFYAEFLPIMTDKQNGFYSFRKFVTKISLNIFRNAEVKKLMLSNATYDAIIMETSLADAFYGFGEHFNASLIGLATLGSDWSHDELIGYTGNSLLEPMDPFGFKPGSTLLDQLYNWMHISEEWLLVKLMYRPLLNQLFEEHFPHVRRSFNEASKSFSLILLNQHFTLCRARPNAPGLVDVGGFHLPQQPPELPTDLAQFIEQSQHGVIYFSLGFEVLSKDLPAETIAWLVDIFETLPQRVIWKYEGKRLANLSSNIYMSPLLPQQAILAHPNVKLFVTHGGMLSVIETVHYANPVLGLPLYFDHFRNLHCLIEDGMGLMLELNTLTKPAFRQALERLLKDPYFRKNALELSKRFWDRPMHPLDTAVYWTEYVLRYKGAPHMRINPNNIKMLDYYDIDKIFMVVSRLAIIFFIPIFLIYKLKCFLLPIKK